MKSVVDMIADYETRHGGVGLSLKNVTKLTPKQFRS